MKERIKKVFILLFIILKTFLLCVLFYPILPLSFPAYILFNINLVMFWFEIFDRNIMKLTKL